MQWMGKHLRRWLLARLGSPLPWDQQCQQLQARMDILETLLKDPPPFANPPTPLTPLDEQQLADSPDAHLGAQ